jgi:hypothetical protein
MDAADGRDASDERPQLIHVMRKDPQVMPDGRRTSRVD